MKHLVGAWVAVSLAAGGAAAQDAPTPKKFPYFAESDIDKNGYLTPAEWTASGRSAKRFLRVDADKDAKVTRAELNAATAAARAATAQDRQPKP